DRRPVAAARAGMAVLELDLGLRNFEDPGGKRNDLLAHALSGHARGRSGIDRLATGERAHALRDCSRAARAHENVGHRAADLVGDDLRERGGGSLPLRGRAGCDRNLTVGKDPHGHAFEWAEPRALDIVADPDAEVAAARTRCRLPRAKAFAAGEL